MQHSWAQISLFLLLLFLQESVPYGVWCHVPDLISLLKWDLSFSVLSPKVIFSLIVS